ncbi:MAG: hypothetical protein AAFR75_05095 [Pseudomonadota bacterium]
MKPAMKLEATLTGAVLPGSVLYSRHIDRGSQSIDSGSMESASPTHVQRADAASIDNTVGQDAEQSDYELGGQSRDDSLPKPPNECAPESEECEGVELLSVSELSDRAERKFLEDTALIALANDPATNSFRVVPESERLEAFASFSQETLDPMWSAEKLQKIQSGISSASNVDLDLNPDLVDCRSSSCLVRFVLDPDTDPMQSMERVSVLLALAGIQARAEIKQTDQFSDVYLTDLRDLELPTRP